MLDAMTNPNAGLTIEFLDHREVVEPGETFVFGRAGNLVIDDNPYLHRRLCRLVFDREVWWIVNEGTRIVVHLIDPLTQSQAALAPGHSAVLTFSQTLVRFEAGSTVYELMLSQERVPAHDAGPDLELGSHTMQLLDVELTEKQRLLLVALCERTLLERPLGVELDPTKVVASRLGWPLTTFNRQLDHVCAKLTAVGVRGLIGDTAELASDRRRRLVAVAIETGLITAENLVELDSDR